MFHFHGSFTDIVSCNPHNHPAQQHYPFIDAGMRLEEISIDLRSILNRCVWHQTPHSSFARPPPWGWLGTFCSRFPSLLIFSMELEGRFLSFLWFFCSLWEALSWICTLDALCLGPD